MKRKLNIILLTTFFSILSINTVQATTVNEEYNRLVSDGTLTLDFVKPKSNKALLDPLFTSDYYNMNYIDNLLTDGFYGGLKDCNSELTECTLVINEWDTGDNIENRVNVNWAEENAEIRKITDKYMNQIYAMYSEGNRLTFTLTDMSLINYYIHSESAYMIISNADYRKGNNILNYVQDIKNLTTDEKITIYIKTNRGMENPMVGGKWGPLAISYDNIEYDITSETGKEAGIALKRVIYIPDETENTPEAYMAAAKKRIDDYLGDNDVKIEILGDIAPAAEEVIEYGDYPQEMFDTAGEYCYNFYFNGHAHNYFIVRDSSKMEKPKTVAEDREKNVSVETGSSEVPLDTKIKVSDVDKKEQDDFDKIIGKDIIKAYNIFLHSGSIGDIKHLNRGTFKVTLFLGAEYRNRHLSAYYLKDDGTVEEYNINVDSYGYATFETKHFSTYFIADSTEQEDNSGIKNPNTVDNIEVYYIIIILSTISLIGCFIYSRKINQY